jgi:ubiquinone biosynthesis protein Coq4
MKKNLFSKIYYYGKFFLAMLTMSRNPEDTSQVFVMADCLYALGLSDQMTAKIMQDEKSREMIKARHKLKPIQLLELQKLPAGTVGRVYADHMISRGLDPNFFPTRELHNDMNYMIMRNRETHDLWHILPGFDTSRTGEIGLQAFMMAQIQAPLTSLLVGGSLLRAGLSAPQQLVPLWKVLVGGYQMGLQAKPVYALDWEAHWATPLAELRNIYGVHAWSET